MKAILILTSLALFASLVDAQCNPSPCGINTRCEVSPSGAAICRCQEGYNHLPGQSTIEGCPTRRQTQTTQNRFERPSRPSRPRRPVQSLPNRISPNIIEVGDPCQPSPCGTNADCSVVGNRAVCTCRANTFGDPYSNCEVNPCTQNPCGTNALCENTGSRAICKCPPGFTGDPFVRCNDNPCSVDPCGGNVDYGSTPEELQEHFKACGQTNRITILVDKFTGSPKGFAYIEFADEQTVQNSLLLNGSLFRARQLKVVQKRTNIPGYNYGLKGKGKGKGKTKGKGKGKYGKSYWDPYDPWGWDYGYMPVKGYKGKGYSPY